jgi:hypothetical protein
MLEELSVDLDSLLAGLFFITKTAGAGPSPELDLLGRGFLFRDSIVDSFRECCEEGEVDGAGDAGAVA